MKKYVYSASGFSFEPFKYTHTHGNNGRYFVKGEYDRQRGLMSAEFTKIAPYDDADYVWAKISPNGQVIFYRDGKVIDKMQMHSYEEDEYENVDEYFNDVIDSIVVELIHFNREIEPRMMYD